MDSDSQKSVLLICAVGGTPDPVVAAIKHWKPVRVCFLHTPQSKEAVDNSIVSKARIEGVDLDPGRYELFELPDGQDLESCLGRLRELTTRIVEPWTAKGNDCEVVVDFTGGTKCMTAAVALQASRWPCRFSYVGGTERTKGGVGVVVSGSEKVVYQANPWDALGHRAIEEFVVLFDQRAFAAARRVADEAKRAVSRAERKRELAALERLAWAFDEWDRFDHKAALNRLEELRPFANDFRAALGSDRADRLLGELDRARTYLQALTDATPPSEHHVRDLLANAQRRREEGRFDDGVARLYRAIEALAQVALARRGLAATDRVPLERVPEPLRSEWSARASGDGRVKLGLQDAWRLLRELQDPLGGKFADAKLDAPISPLAKRNTSILAHGFDQLSEKDFNALWRCALTLAACDETTLPRFPVLRSA